MGLPRILPGDSASYVSLRCCDANASEPQHSNASDLLAKLVHGVVSAGVVSLNNGPGPPSTQRLSGRACWGFANAAKYKNPH